MVNNPWLDLVQNWQKSFAAPQAGMASGADFWSQAAPMFAFGQMLSTLQQQNASLGDRDSWLRGWNDMLDAMRAPDSRPSDPVSRMFQDMMKNMAPGAAPFFSWPGQAQPAPLANWPSWLDLLNPMMANEPHLGPAREWQGKITDVSQAASGWMESQQQLQRSHLDVMLDAWKQLGTDAFEQSKDGNASVRDMFDKWVETAESLYQERVTTEDYSELFGEYVNRMSAMKLAVQKVLDDVLAMLDLPTRQELNGMQEQQAAADELRPDVAALQAEIAALRAHVDALTDQLNLAEPVAAEQDEPAKSADKPARKRTSKAGKKKAAKSSGTGKTGTTSESDARTEGTTEGQAEDKASAREWDIDRLS